MANLIRSRGELDLMRKSGEITAWVLKKTLASVRAGMSLAELDKIAEDEIKRLGGESSFKTVPGYKFTTCLNVNAEVVHGIPRPEVILQTGDILKVDLGAIFKGWHTDAAWTVVVESELSRKSQESRLLTLDTSHFLAVGEEAMWAGINRVKDGNHIGDISEALNQVITKNGFNVVRSLAGHGVGKSGHEEPEIPLFGKKGQGMELKSGMTLAVEVIYVTGSDEMETLEDNWTLKTIDGGIAGLFENSVIVTDTGAEVLTDWRKY